MHIYRASLLDSALSGGASRFSLPEAFLANRCRILSDVNVSLIMSRFYANLKLAFALFDARHGIDEASHLAGMRSVIASCDNFYFLSSLLSFSDELNLPSSLQELINWRMGSLGGPSLE